VDYAMITHSVVGFKPKKFDLVHQTVFLVKEVWSGHETNYVDQCSMYLNSFPGQWFRE